ncbi:MAG: hypothetical protein P1U56_11820 [Saprospiraceae bacterium]|nr:hypothetical protein [Saprospiraceae bacterium]
MRKFTLAFICTILISSAMKAQHSEETLFGNSSISLTGVWAGSTNGLVEFDNNFSLSNSGYFLFEVNNDLLIGWSGYGSGTNLENGDKAEIGGNDLVLGYAFNSNKSIHPIIYAKGGRGSLKINEQKVDKVTVFEPSVGVEMNVLRWFKVGLEGGYRFVTNVDADGLNDNDFSSPVVGLRLKFGWSWD